MMLLRIVGMLLSQPAKQTRPWLDGPVMTTVLLRRRVFATGPKPFWLPLVTTNVEVAREERTTLYEYVLSRDLELPSSLTALLATARLSGMLLPCPPYPCTAAPSRPYPSADA